MTTDDPARPEFAAPGRIVLAGFGTPHRVVRWARRYRQDGVDLLPVDRLSAYTKWVPLTSLRPACQYEDRSDYCGRQVYGNGDYCGWHGGRPLCPTNPTANAGAASA